MRANVDAALAFVFKDEGGFAIRNTEGGGAVNKGITFTVFEAWRLSHGHPQPTFDDLEKMTKEEATDIYVTQFLSGVHFDELPAGVDYAVYDASITGGVAGSIKLLQKVLGLKDDGHYGLVTKWAANHRPVPELINKLCDIRIAKYKTFKRWNVIANPDKPPEKQVTWGTIWGNRIEVVRKRSMSMVTAAAFVPPPSPAVPAVTKPGGSFPPVRARIPVSTELSRGMIKRGGTVEQFLTYLREELAPQMGVWRPSMVVLHNTDKMSWPAKVFHKSTGVTETLTPEQQIDNMSVNWTKHHFPSTPHLLLPPDGMVWLLWPMWKPGTHAPSWNQISWGVETVGDFDVDVPTPAFLRTLPLALAGMYALLGRAPNGDTFKLHKEDPGTTHKRCPGKNLGTKASLLKDITGALQSMNSKS